jgi:glycosyltransferase involved in cell wall biosynthesis
MNMVPVYEWFWASKIKKFITKNNLEILHAHDLYMSKCTKQGIRKSGRKVKMILDLHENFAYAVTTYNWTKGFLRRTIAQPENWKKREKEYLGYPNKIIVLSEEFRDSLLSIYPDLKQEDFCPLPNVPDVSQMSDFIVDEGKIPFRKNFPILFYFGVVAERRGIFDALIAFEKVITKGYDIDFMIIGPVDKKDLTRFNEMISSPKIKERIIYIPWIDLSELPSYLHISDICIAPFHKNPQHESGVANKIYDYMLGGKPIIASNCKPQQNLLQSHHCGLIFENIPELAKAIIMLLNDEDLRIMMGENGKKAVLQKYNTEVFKGGLIKFYNALRTNQ